MNDTHAFIIVVVVFFGQNMPLRLCFYVLAMSAFEEQPVSIKVQEGGMARFSCKITANPPTVITWEVNRTSLPLAVDR